MLQNYNVPNNIIRKIAAVYTTVPPLYCLFHWLPKRTGIRIVIFILFFRASVANYNFLLHILRHHVIIVIIQTYYIRFVHAYIWIYVYGTNVVGESKQRNQCTLLNILRLITSCIFIFQIGRFPWSCVICIRRCFEPSLLSCACIGIIIE